MISLSSDENRNLRAQNGLHGHHAPLSCHNSNRQIRRHYSGTSSTFTFGGPSSLSTVSTNLSSTNQLNNFHEMTTFSPSNDNLSDEGDFSGYFHPVILQQKYPFYLLSCKRCILQIEKKWEYPRKNLIFEKTIGEGEFGKVMSARAIDRSSASGKN